jgi:hypothetical protein
MAVTGEPDAEGPQEERRQERLRILDLSAVGLAFPIALLLGYFAGRAIGGWLGSAQLGGMIGALVGIIGGFYNLFKMVSRLAPRHTGATPPPAPPIDERRTVERAGPERHRVEVADPPEDL